MLPLITSKIKDDTLTWLCHNIRPGQPTDIDFTALEELTGLDQETLEAILEDFKERGLVGPIKSMRGGTVVTLKIKAHGFLTSGGFTVIDALNEANMQKLLYELQHLQKQLKPDQLETYNKIAAIGSAVASALAAFSDKI